MVYNKFKTELLPAKKLISDLLVGVAHSVPSYSLIIVLHIFAAFSVKNNVSPFSVNSDVKTPTFSSNPDLENRYIICFKIFSFV